MEPLQVTCALILKDGKILATRRGPKQDLPGKWEFPGGKLEPGEREREGIVREIKEELTLTIEPVVRLAPNVHRYPTFTIRLIPFLARYVSGEIELREHDDYRWCTAQELDRLQWAPADEPILDELLSMEIIE